MKQLFVLTALVLMFSATTRAQSDEYHKIEFFGGYSAMKFDNLGGDTGNPAVDAVLGGRDNLRGLNASITRNFNKYWGAKFDYSLHLREDNFSRPQGNGTVDTTIQNFLGGIQVKNNSHDGPTFKPFGHALFGVANQKIDIDSPQLTSIFGFNDFHVNETSFAMAFGGGLDLKVNHRIDARVVQADWNIIRRGDQLLGTGPTFVLPNTRQDNLRLSFGIVIH